MTTYNATIETSLSPTWKVRVEKIGPVICRSMAGQLTDIVFVPANATNKSILHVMDRLATGLPQHLLRNAGIGASW
jgi:hypothetical protein